MQRQICAENKQLHIPDDKVEQIDNRLVFGTESRFQQLSCWAVDASLEPLDELFIALVAVAPIRWTSLRIKVHHWLESIIIDSVMLWLNRMVYVQFHERLLLGNKSKTALWTSKYEYFLLWVLQPVFAQCTRAHNLLQWLVLFFHSIWSALFISCSLNKRWASLRRSQWMHKMRLQNTMIIMRCACVFGEMQILW